MTFLTVSQQTILLAALMFCVVFFGLRFGIRFVVAQLEKIARKTNLVWDEMLTEFLSSIHMSAYVAIAVYVAVTFLELPAHWQQWVHAAVFIVVSITMLISFQQFLLKGLHIIMRKRAVAAGDDEEAGQAMTQFISTIIKIILWVLVSILIAQNLGLEVGALLGGLGVFGIAVGFALQHVLGDFFAFFSIYFDKPFAVGDYIVVNDVGGTVKHIGIKSTRIATLRGEEMVVSNKHLTETAVHNFKRLERRRSVFTFTVTYQTTPDQLAKIPEIVADIFSKIPTVELGRVHLLKLADYGLEFEVEYYVAAREYLVYADAQHSINMELLKRFDKLKIEFAYPTQTVFVQKS